MERRNNGVTLFLFSSMLGGMESDQFVSSQLFLLDWMVDIKLKEGASITFFNVQ